MNICKKYYYVGGIIATIMFVGEVTLRMYLGMCDAPLYKENNK